MFFPLSRSRFAFGSLGLMVAVAAPLTAPGLGWAQTAPPAGPAPAVAPPKPPTLGEALLRVPWEVGQGVLLTLTPSAPLPAPPKVFNTDGGLPPANADGNVEWGATAPVTEAEAAQMLRLLQTPPENANAPLRLSSVARVWKKRVQTFGGVTVAAPPTMTVLNPRPGPPDLLADLSDGELTQMLFATFSPSQWRLLASTNGIGRGDLQTDQTPLFDRLIPAPFTYTFATTHYYGRVNDPALTHTLSNGERQGVRLRVKLQTDVGAPMLGQGSEGRFFPILFNGNRDGGIFGDNKNVTPFLDIVHTKEAQSRTDTSTDTVINGVSVAQEIRNKPKPADLDFGAVSGTVSLAPPPLPAPFLTIGDLMPRLKQATGLEIYADARLAKRRVWTRGADSAQAGDVLAALCFCIGGTVRKVEAPDQKPAYVLTSDGEGIAAREGILDDWQSLAQVRKDKIKADYLQAVRKINPLPFLEFDSQDPVKLPRSLVDRVATGGAGVGGPKGYLVVKPSELTPAQQAYLNAGVAGSASHKGFEVGSDKYELSVSLWLGIVVPGVGEITGSPLQTVHQIVPEPANAAPPAKAEGASLWARVPTKGDEAASAAREIVDGALRRKMKAVYLDGASPAVLQAAILEAAQTQTTSGPLAVWGVLRPLQAKPNQENVPVDINARRQTSREYREGRGETAMPAAFNWRLVSSPQTEKAAQTEAGAMAAVSGLGGMVIVDALPPGYRNGTESGVNPGDGNADFRLGAGLELGWTPQQRLEFLRQNHADPLDVVPYFPTGQTVNIPYFPDSGSSDNGLADAWSKYRAERGQAFLTRLRQNIDRAKPGLPVQVGGQINENPLSHTPQTAWLVDWLAVPNSGKVRLYWNYPKQGVPLSMVARQGITGASAPGSAAPRAFLRLPFGSVGAALLRGGTGWDGVVFDLSDVPPGEETTAQVHKLLDGTP